MKVFWHKKDDNKKLLLLFNGWGFDHKIFDELDFPGFDIVSVCNYSNVKNVEFNFTELYNETRIMAWSYGVFAADFYSQSIFNIKKAIAVNGTTTPIDNYSGIPVNIFMATMQSLNEKTRDKFYIRIAGGLTPYKKIVTKLPDREVEDQLIELKKLYELSLIKRNNGINWDNAIISQQDKIFPYTNMLNAWGNKAITIEGEHYTDFGNIIENYLI